MRLRLLLATLLGFALPLGGAARASTFDPGTGKLTLDGAFSDGLDRADGLTIRAVDEKGAPLAQADVNARFADDPTALEGSGAFFAGGTVHTVAIDFTSLGPKLAGHRVDARIWMRPGGPPGSSRLSGTRATAFLVWYLGAVEAATLQLQPTGRGTDDGWREYSTGPVDFALAGQHNAPELLIRDDQLVGTTQDPFAEFPTAGVDEDVDARVALDALEVRDLGAALVPTRACDAMHEASECGAGGVCYAGACADAAAAVGAVPQNDSIRSAFVDRVRFIYRAFEGIRYAAGQESAVDQALAQAATLTDPVAFWSTFQAIRAFEDAHSQPPTPFGAVAPDAGLCLGLGTADLLPGAPSGVPMVYHADPARGAGPSVEPGDVLTAIDGVPVATWEAAQSRLFYIPGDPRSNPVYQMLLLPGAAAVTGATLTFQRCDRNQHSQVPCTPAEIQTITVDLGTLLAPKLWSGAAQTSDTTPTPCDPRFSRPIDSPDSYAYAFAGSVDVAPDTRVLLINGVPAETMPGGELWKTNVQNAVSVPRAKFVLDERMGDGGWTDPAFPLIFGSLFDGAVPIRAEVLPSLEGAPLAPALDAMRACWAGSRQTDCGEYEQFAYDGTGFSKNNGTAKLAVLAGLDVSGNDFLTRFIRTRSGPTRLFGVVPTMGGYGTIAILSGYGIAPRGGSVQLQDTIFTTGDQDPNRMFESATGVVPDEIVMEKQSDAIVGVDSLYAAALAWVEAP